MTGHLRVLDAQEPTLDVTEFRRVLVESGLGATRPLVGVARCVTDFAWSCRKRFFANALPEPDLK